MGFEESLRFGKMAETRIAQALRQQQFTILPVYPTVEAFKGPVVLTPDGSGLVAPDMLAIRVDEIRWVEAKHKTAFTWHRITSKWTTGIDLHHYKDYQQIQALSPWEIWLYFWQEPGKAKDTPENLISPSGLYADTLRFLETHENHTDENWGRTGMVYWAEETFRCYDSLESIMLT